MSNSGIWGHSSGADKPLVIFSVDQIAGANRNLVDVIGRRHAIAAYAEQHGGIIKELVGRWQGSTEISFLVTAEVWGAIASHPLIGGQECVLHLGACDARDRKPARLLWANGDESDVGLFQSVPAPLALHLPGWTYDPIQGTFFACLDRQWTRQDVMTEARWPVIARAVNAEPETIGFRPDFA